MSENLQAVVTSVNDILNDTNLSSLTSVVTGRLVYLGYSPTVTDGWLIAYAMQKSVNHVLNQINHQTVPDGLREIVVDMICGEILQGKFLSGQLNMDGLDLSGIVNSVNMGDTSVSFSTEGSDEAKLQELLRWMIQGKGCDLLCYRKLRW